MFKDLDKYSDGGSFSFVEGSILSIVSKEVPKCNQGIYLVYKEHVNAKRLELVYIGKSGTINQTGDFKTQGLFGRINNKHEGIKRHLFFTKKLQDETIKALQVHWYVTVTDDINDLPGYVEGLLLQRYFETNRKLPQWNKCF